MRSHHYLTHAVALAVTLAACGGSDAPASNAAASTSSVASSDATTGAQHGDASGDTAALNEADISFAQGMIAHHEQAIAMADLALAPNAGASPDVVDLATRIKGAQGPEVDMMAAWLTSAGQPIDMDMSGGHDMSSMDGMMTTQDMTELAAKQTGEFDRAWLEMMIAHHEGAISQSEEVMANGSNLDVRALAGQIITAQQGEITEMQALLDG